ncbi:MAG: hypothetical protein ACOCY5_05125 [Desulfohalobiaceae bacterium]
MSLLLHPLEEQARARAKEELEWDEALTVADRAEVEEPGVVALSREGRVKEAEPEDAAQIREVKAREVEPGAKVLDKAAVARAGELNKLAGRSVRIGQGSGQAIPFSGRAKGGQP